MPPPVPSAPRAPTSSTVRFVNDNADSYDGSEYGYAQGGPVRPPTATYDPATPRPTQPQQRQSRDMTAPSRGMSTNSSPTPGLDDSPYIRFAIDQLTRDEEVVRQGRYSVAGQVPGIPAPVTEHRPQKEPRPEATRRHLRAAEMAALGGAAAVATAAATAPEEEVPEPGSPGSPQRSQHPQRWRSERRGYGYNLVDKEDDDLVPAQSQAIPSHDTERPQSYVYSCRDSSPADAAGSGLVLVAADAPEHDLTHPPLKYLPFVLRLPFLLLTIILLGAVLGLLIASLVLSKSNGGLLSYDGVGTSTYFLFEYLPQVIGILVLLVLWTIQAAVYRVTVFANLAGSNPSTGALQHLSTVSRNFVLPDMSFYRHGEPLVGIALCCVWFVGVFGVPVLACLYQTQLFSGHWRWAVVQSVAYAAIAVYAIALVAVVLILVRFTGRMSGLLWDPRTVADLIPIFQRSNVLSDFEELETAYDIATQFPARELRLGYWRVGEGKEVFYGVGEEGRPMGAGGFTKRNGWKDRVGYGYGNDLEQGTPGTANTVDSFQRNIHSPFLRYRWTPWFLRDTCVIAWIAAAFVLLIAFLVVSYIHSNAISGFEPLLPSHTSVAGFSASNFLYSFLPAFLGQLLLLFWQPIDTYFRHIQPYAALSSPNGATAPKSLLLDYTNPLTTPLAAFLSHDFKVAVTSLTTLLALPIPILAGGTFTAQYFSSRNSSILIAAESTSFHALTFFLVCYALAFTATFPTRKRYLPHPFYTAAERATWGYASPLWIRDQVVREPSTNVDLGTRLMVLPPGELPSPYSSGGAGALYTRKRDSGVSTSTRDKREDDAAGLMDGEMREEREVSKKGKQEVGPRYAFGIYRGTDGREHLGIDRLERRGRPGVLVTTGGR